MREETKKKVIVAGHICLDVTPSFKNSEVGRADEILKPGKLIEVGKANVNTGGAVANTGLAMKILGADVRLIGKTGKDAFGNMITEVLDRYQAGSWIIQSETDSTSYSIVLALPGVDRIFLHNPGANDTFTSADVPYNEIKDASLFHFGYPPIMAGMYKDNGSQLVTMMKRVHDMGIATSLDLAAVDPNSEAGKQDWREILSRTLPYVDIFVPSVEELCYMLDRDRFNAWQEKAAKAGTDIPAVLDPEKDVQPLAAQCIEMGVKILLIKCGAPGMYCRSASKEELQKITPRIGIDPEKWAGLEIFERSYIPDRVLSGTGAGDTSIAAFLTAILNEYKPEDCIHLAAAEGASCVAGYDALSEIKTLDELKKRIDSGWEKVAE